MKKELLVLLAFAILLSCNSKRNFEMEFNDCLSSDQIDLILQINTEFDEFVTGKLQIQNGNLNDAYYFMTESISKKGDFADYWYPNEKLLRIKSKLIKTGLFSNLDSEESFRINFKNGNYLKCLNEVGKRNKEVQDGLNVMLESGQYSLSVINLKLGILAEKKEIESITKKLLTFQFIIGQIEEITTANKVYN